MNYSARQLHCLNAMGLVAWSSRRLKTPQTPSDEQGLALHATTATALSDDWVTELSSRLLCEFTHRGASVKSVGKQSASLIVVCMLNGHQDSCAQLPLSDECMQLFDLMMRSIALNRSNIRLCAVDQLAAEHRSETEHNSTVSSLIGAQNRAVLLLDNTLGEHAAQRSGDSNATSPARLSEQQLPVWRIPHPELLLKDPSLKRGAWETLKALKLVLQPLDQI